MSSVTDRGIASISSSHSFADTLQRFRALLQQKSITLFAEIDHSGEAEKAGMSMPPTRVLIFGNPAAGTPLMLAAPTTALDLPLKILFAEQQDGSVLLSWNDPVYLQSRHGFPADMVRNIAAAAALASAAVS